MLAVKGVYKNGKIELLEPLPAIASADLFIVVVPHHSKEQEAGYETAPGFPGGTVMESSVDWGAVDDTKGPGATPETSSDVLRQIVKPDADGFIRIQAPKGLGDCFELFLLPAGHLEKGSDFFERVDEKGIPYRLDEWTEKEFNVQSMKGAFNGDPTQAEDIFDV